MNSSKKYCQLLIVTTFFLSTTYASADALERHIQATQKIDLSVLNSSVETTKILQADLKKCQTLNEYQEILLRILRFGDNAIIAKNDEEKAATMDLLTLFIIESRPNDKQILILDQIAGRAALEISKHLY